MQFRKKCNFINDFKTTISIYLKKIIPPMDQHIKPFRSIIISFVILLFPFSLSAQYNFKDWGKINIKDLKMTTYEADTSAIAVILEDDHKVELLFSPQLVAEYSIHRKIKILKKEGVSFANVTIPYLENCRYEDLTNFRAHTINLDENGIPEFTKLESDGEFVLKDKNGFQTFKFSMPAVKIGSIIEYNLTFKSSYNVLLTDWVFQKAVPVVHSSFATTFPREIKVNVLQQGKLLAKEYGDRPTRVWSLDSLPALKNEPYSPKPEDFVDRIRLQLDKVRTFGIESDEQGYYRLYNTWDKLTSMLLKKNYNDFVKDTFMARKEIEPLRLSDSSDIAKAREIQQYMTKTYVWNGDVNCTTNQNLHDFIASKRGNSAEINLFLVQMLKQAGLNAHALLTSTKENGRVSKLYPFIDAFNYLIAAVDLQSGRLFLDATNPYLPFYLPNKDILNTNGLEVRDSVVQWNPIPILGKNKIDIQEVIDYSTPNKAFLTNKVMLSQYGAESLRKFLNDSTNTTNVLSEQIWGSNSDWILDSTSITNKNNKELPLVIYGKFSQEQNTSGNGIVYIKPFSDLTSNQVVFTAPTRSMPIDLEVPIEYTYVTTIKLPKGYRVQELPEQMSVVLPNKKGALIINYFNNGNELTAQRTFIISNPFFMPEEYTDLKNIFDSYRSSSKAMMVVGK